MNLTAVNNDSLSTDYIRAQVVCGNMPKGYKVEASATVTIPPRAKRKLM